MWVRGFSRYVLSCNYLYSLSLYKQVLFLVGLARW